MRVLVFVAGLSAASTSVADQADTFFTRGNEYYQAGDYLAAQKEYEQILETGFESWQVYYNLGNCYFKTNDIGHAILNFERAKRLAPKNEDVLYNLEFANLKTVDRIETLPRFFLAAWISGASQMLSLNMLGGVTMALYFALAAIIILRMFYTRAQLRQASTIAFFAISSVLFIFTILFLFRIVEVETTVHAILLEDKVDVMSAPSEGGTEVFTLHEGVKVSIEERSLEWAKIKLADGKVGWLKQAVLEEI
jgi:hypothetical protein